MPLYGAKLFHTLPASASPIKPEDGQTVYQIDYTAEKFSDQNLYEETLKIYDERIWTDRCTGAMLSL